MSSSLSASLPNSLPKAILFDHDGTLIDSESTHFALWNQALKPYGVAVDEAFYNEVMAGIPVPQNAEDVIAHFNLDVPPTQLAAEKQAITADFLAKQAFPLMPGAKEVLHACYDAGVTLAIVTGGTGLSVKKTVSTYGFEGMFSTVVAVEDVAHSKPAPDCYLKALSQLGLSANETMAVEDTEHGLKAAVAAGLACVALPTPLSIHHDFSTASRQYSCLLEWWQTEMQPLIK